MSSFAYLDHDGVIPFAHRGGSVKYPENTLAAFAYAVGLGYRYLETDVHASRDGVLFAFHDPDLGRMTGQGGRIAEMTAAEIDEVRITDSDGESHRIPRLEALVASWPHCRFNIDAKSDDGVGPLIQFVRHHRLIDQVCIGSFSLSRLRACRRALGPGLCTSMAPSEIGRFYLASRGLLPPPRRAACAQIPPSSRGIPLATSRLIEFAHDHDVAVHVWTINDAKTMSSLVAAGVDGIMTDEVNTLLNVLDPRT